MSISVLTHGGRITSLRVVDADGAREYPQDIVIRKGDEISVSWSNVGTPKVNVVRRWSRRWIWKRLTERARRVARRVLP